MTTGSIVLESDEQIDDRTSHAIVAAQLRGEARAKGRDRRSMVRAIAAELQGLGLRPNHPELARRYDVGETKLPTWLRRDGRPGPA
ncbi:hypothetical protein [Phycicoccus avicenniae]|uniref:hypothetical protein n=1 Tax=Phycicoccus avicenniae TaxID=2828860 RepID=UPI003D2D9BAE